jgi:uncharacterized lipoprotein YmbA
MNALKSAALAVLVTLLGACASPSPAPVLLTLPSVVATANAAAPASPAASTPLVAVRRVNIPEYLVARRVRYRADSATLAEWPNTYWAERIEIGVSREFVSALREQLPGWDLCEENCGDQNAGMSLQIDLVPLDFLRTAQTLQARARITLSGAGMPAKVLAAKEVGYEIAAGGDNPQAQAQAISTLIQRVAADAAPLVRNTRP